MLYHFNNLDGEEVFPGDLCEYPEHLKIIRVCIGMIDPTDTQEASALLLTLTCASAVLDSSSFLYPHIASRAGAAET